MKTILEVRPIFHWTELRIKGNVINLRIQEQKGRRKQLN